MQAKTQLSNLRPTEVEISSRILSEHEKHEQAHKFAAFFPLWRTYLKRIRLALSHKNTEDNKEIQAEWLGVLNYLRKYHYFIFLIVTGNIDLLNNILAKEKAAELQSYIDKVPSNEWPVIINLNFTEKEPDKVVIREPSERITEEDMQRFMALSILYQIDFLEYLHKQMDLYDDASSGLKSQLSTAISSIDDDEFKKEAEALMAELDAAETELNALKETHKDEAKDDIEVAKIINKAAKELFEKSKKVRELFRRFRHLKGMEERYNTVDTNIKEMERRDGVIEAEFRDRMEGLEHLDGDTLIRIKKEAKLAEKQAQDGLKLVKRLNPALAQSLENELQIVTNKINAITVKECALNKPDVQQTIKKYRECFDKIHKACPQQADPKNARIHVFSALEKMLAEPSSESKQTASSAVNTMKQRNQCITSDKISFTEATFSTYKSCIGGLDLDDLQPVEKEAILEIIREVEKYKDTDIPVILLEQLANLISQSDQSAGQDIQKLITENSLALS